MNERNEPRIRDKQTRTFAKRFYKTVLVGETEDGYTVLLDGKAVRTPMKAPLVVPLEAIARTVADEFEAQETELVPGTMPMTRLANSAIDTVGADMDAVTDEFAAYAGSDLLCYRAATPERLAARQAECWDPLLDWAARDIGVTFRTVAGIVHQAQPDGTVAAMRAQAGALDCFGLCALHTITALTGSAVIALAVARGTIESASAWDAAMIDEDWQIEHWGEDMEAARRRAQRRRDFDAACRLIEMLHARI